MKQLPMDMLLKNIYANIEHSYYIEQNKYFSEQLHSCLADT